MISGKNIKEVLVTGGNGFIGSHFISKSCKKFSSINFSNVDNLSYAASPNTQNYLNKFKNYNFYNIDITNAEKLKEIFSKNTRDEKDLNYSISLIKKYNVINACYQKAQHYINLASNSLSVFNDCEEKNILESLTSFSLSRNF